MIIHPKTKNKKILFFLYFLIMDPSNKPICKCKEVLLVLISIQYDYSSLKLKIKDTLLPLFFNNDHLINPYVM